MPKFEDYDDIYDEPDRRVYSQVDYLTGRSGTHNQCNTIDPRAAALQSTGGAMQEGANIIVEPSKGFGNFINTKWRPMMAIVYMVTCVTDFILFPVLWSMLQAVFQGTVTNQWQPLTLQGAGLYHIAMGTVLGLAAYGRSQEKMAGKA